MQCFLRFWIPSVYIYGSSNKSSEDMKDLSFHIFGIKCFNSVIRCRLDLSCKPMFCISENVFVGLLCFFFFFFHNCMTTNKGFKKWRGGITTLGKLSGFFSIFKGVQRFGLCIYLTHKLSDEGSTPKSLHLVKQYKTKSAARSKVVSKG